MNIFIIIYLISMILEAICIEIPIMYKLDGRKQILKIPPRPVCVKNKYTGWDPVEISTYHPDESEIPMRIVCKAEKIRTSCYTGFFGDVTYLTLGKLSRPFTEEDKMYMNSHFGTITSENVHSTFLSGRWNVNLEDNIYTCSWLRTVEKLSNILECHLEVNPFDSIELFLGKTVKFDESYGGMNLISETLTKCSFLKNSVDACIMNKNDVICPHTERSFKLGYTVCENGMNNIRMSNNGALISANLVKVNTRYKRDSNGAYPSEEARKFFQEVSDLLGELERNDTGVEQYSRNKRSLVSVPRITAGLDPSLSAITLDELNFRINSLSTYGDDSVFSSMCISVQQEWDSIVSQSIIDCHKLYKHVHGSSKVLCRPAHNGWEVMPSRMVPYAESKKAVMHFENGTSLVTLNNETFVWEPFTGLLIPENMSLTYHRKTPSLYLFVEGYKKSLSGNLIDYDIPSLTFKLKYLSVNRSVHHYLERLDESSGWVSPISDDLNSKELHNQILNLINRENILEVIGRLFQINYIKWIVIIIIIIILISLILHLKNRICCLSVGDKPVYKDRLLG
ncbi:MAG: hypothetical protein FuRV3_gp4 [Hangzhou rhabdovirus 3]|nr:MAG: hypothetical protein FuRV3_gp4 [Hangzhou rhabdovirus 3]